MTSYLLYNGSFNGFLCALGETYSLKTSNVSIVKKEGFAPDLFQESVRVIQSNGEKAKQISAAIKTKISSSAYESVKLAFYSEEQGIENAIAAFLDHGFRTGNSILHQFQSKEVATVLKAARRTEFECHRHLGIIRFRRLSDQTLYSPIQPDTCILPFLGDHFQNRFSGENWIIHDQKRELALTHQRDTGDLCYLSIPGESPDYPGEDATEKQYQRLWKEYFHSTANPQRANPKLQRQFLPKKYWKNITELEGEL